MTVSKFDRRRCTSVPRRGLIESSDIASNRPDWIPQYQLSRDFPRVIPGRRRSDSCSGFRARLLGAWTLSGHYLGEIVYGPGISDTPGMTASWDPGNFPARIQRLYLSTVAATKWSQAIPLPRACGRGCLTLEEKQEKGRFEAKVRRGDPGGTR